MVQWRKNKGTNVYWVAMMCYMVLAFDSPMNLLGWFNYPWFIDDKMKLLVIRRALIWSPKSYSFQGYAVHWYIRFWIGRSWKSLCLLWITFQVVALAGHTQRSWWVAAYSTSRVVWVPSPHNSFLSLFSPAALRMGDTALLVITHLGSLASNLPPPSHQSFGIH